MSNLLIAWHFAVSIGGWWDGFIAGVSEWQTAHSPVAVRIATVGTGGCRLGWKQK